MIFMAIIWLSFDWPVYVAILAIALVGFVVGTAVDNAWRRAGEERR